MPIRIEAEGVSPELSRRAAEAASSFLAAAGVTPEQAAQGAWAREGWGLRGFAEDAEPTADELHWADAWDHALDAATEVIGFEIDLIVEPFGSVAASR
jgi:hypothetical protein